MRRVLPVLAATLFVGAAVWLACGGDVPAAPPTAGDSTASVSPAPNTNMLMTAIAPVVRSSAPPDAAWWLEGLIAPAVEPLVPTTDAEGGTVSGRLTVREQPWLHPQGLEVRITRCWLDTVLPLTDETAPGAPQRDEPVTHSDAEGRFTLRLAPGAGELFFLIGRTSDTLDFQRIPRLPRRGEHVELGDVWLDQRGGSTGTVVDGDGKPLANVLVRAVDDPLLDTDCGLDDLRAERTRGLELFQARGTATTGALPPWVVRRDAFLPFPSAHTDAAGRFHLRGQRPGTHRLCFTETRAEQIVHHGAVDDVLVAAGRDTDIGTVTLRHTDAVTLRFVDERDQPWQGAEVAFVQRQPGIGSVATTTDRQGRVDLQVPQVNEARLVFAYPGGGPWLELPGWRTTTKSTILVRRPPVLSIHLVDLDGKAVLGGQVRAYVVGGVFRPVDRLLPAAMQPVPTPGGEHVGALPCPVVLVAVVPGFAPAIQHVDDAGRVVLTMLPLATMTVATHDLEGKPVADAAIRIQVHADPTRTLPGMQWTALVEDRVLVGHTDDRGELQVPCWSTIFSLQASHPDYAPSAGARLPVAPGERRTILLRQRAQLFGTVTVAGEPAPRGLRVRVQQRPPAAHELANSGFLGEQIAVVDAAGAFACRDLSAGFWKLTPELPPIDAAGTAAATTFRSIEVLLSDGQELHCVVEAQGDPSAPPSLRGQVRRDGVPLAGVLVRLRAATAPIVRQRSEHRQRARQRPGEDLARPALGDEAVSPWLQRATTDLAGGFAFAYLEPGRDYELRFDVAAAGRLQFLARRVVRAGSDTRPAVSDFTFATGSLHLTCVHGMAPFANRMVRLRQVLEDGQEGARFDVLLDAMGEVVLDDLPAGSWTVQPTHGGTCQPALITIEPRVVRAATLQVTD